MVDVFLLRCFQGARPDPRFFMRCIQGARPDPWNWNVYLFPLWCLGCGFRWGILFPLRCSLLSRLPLAPDA